MTFDTPGPVLLRVNLDGGEVGIETSPGPRVDVELIPLRDNDITRQVIEEARVEMSPRGAGHEVIVDLKRKAGLRSAAAPRSVSGCAARREATSSSAPARPISTRPARSERSR